MIDNHFEKSVLQNAKQVVFVNKSTEEDYQKKYSFLKINPMFFTGVMMKKHLKPTPKSPS